MLRAFCLLAVLLPRLVSAMCADAHLSVWPSTGRPLPANGQVVLEGYGLFEEPVARVAELSPRLVVGEEAIPLRVIAVHRGEMRLTQAVLQPERPLQPGKRYTLRLTEPKDLAPELWESVKSMDMEWRATSADVTPPRWLEAPSTVGQNVEWFGCGPAVHVDVSAAVEDEGALVQVLAEVRRTDGGAPVRFRLTPSQKKVELGHGMCSGGFKLQEGMRYAVRLIAVDMAGNESVAPGGEVLIQGPKL